MNKIANQFLLGACKIVPEMHLRQPRVTYSACRSFTKNKERIQKFKGTGNSKDLYQHEFNEACFQNGMAYGDLPKRTASDKVLYDKAFNIARNPKYDGNQREVSLMVYNFFDKKCSGGAIKS